MSQSVTPGLWQLMGSLSFLSGHNPIIGAGWTLEFEMLFYVSTAAALALAPARWKSIVFVLAAAGIVGPYASEYIGPLAPLLSPLLLEFLLGILAAELFCTGRVPAPRLAAAASSVSVAYSQGWTGVLWIGVGSA